MAESASKQLLSALTEGQEKANSKAATAKKNSKTAVKNTAAGKGSNQNRNHRGAVSGGQNTVTSSSKCKSHLYCIRSCPLNSFLFIAIKSLKSDTSSSSNTTVATSTTASSSRAPRKRLLNILLNANSTTEEDTEEEIPATTANKKTKRRRRNFSSSTSSSYSSSLATNSTIHSNNVTPATAKKSSGEGQSSSSVKKDLIAYRTRSRTQSVERGVDLDTTSKNISLGQKRKSSRASRSQLLSDSDIEDDSQEEQADNESVDKSDKNSSSKKTIAKSARGAGAGSSKKSSEKLNNNNNKKSIDSSANSSVNSDKNQSQATSRTLRSRSTVDLASSIASSLRRNPTSSSSAATSVIPKKRIRIGEQSHQSSGSTNPESTGSGSKTPNLGARLARNQGGREPHYTAQQQDTTSSTQASTSTQQQSGHPPQHLLRRSSRGKGSSSSSTTGSCVSFSHYCIKVSILTNCCATFCRFHHQLPLTLSPLVQQ